MGGSADVLRLLRFPIVLGGFLGFSLGYLRGVGDGGALDAARFAACYLVVFLADASTHFGNSFYDAELDGGAPVKPFSTQNILSSRPELRGAAYKLTLACVAGSLLSAALAVTLLGVDPLLLLLAVLGNALGFAYSHPRTRLVESGLGEVAIGVSTGLLLVAAGYVASGAHLGLSLLAYSQPLALWGVTLALALEIPDAEADSAKGKRNLVVRLGRQLTFQVMLVLSFAAAALTAWRATVEVSASLSLIQAVAAFVPSVALLMSDPGDQRSSADLMRRYVYALFLVLAVLIVSLAAAL